MIVYKLREFPAGNIESRIRMMNAEGDRSIKSNEGVHRCGLKLSHRIRVELDASADIGIEGPRKEGNR